jgi:hypothetical protein
MPTQIPTKTCVRSSEPSGALINRTPARGRSWVAEAKEILMLSLLAAAMVYTIAFAIIRAYI